MSPVRRLQVTRPTCTEQSWALAERADMRRAIAMRTVMTSSVISYQVMSFTVRIQLTCGLLRKIAYTMYQTPVQYSIHYLRLRVSWCCFSSTLLKISRLSKSVTDLACHRLQQMKAMSVRGRTGMPISCWWITSSRISRFTNMTWDFRAAP